MRTGGPPKLKSTFQHLYAEAIVMRKFTLRWVAVCGALGALLLVYGCSSSSS